MSSGRTPGTGDACHHSRVSPADVRVHRVRALGRAAFRTRAGRLTRQTPLLLQASVAASLSWLVATAVLGHTEPFFAPAAAIIALGASYGTRLRRMLEVISGVAIGVAVGDALVALIGTGVWQVGLVVLVAMSVAVLLDAGSLIVIQAGVQSAIVSTLLPSTGDGFDRWVDALVGGGVALLVAVVAPAGPLRRPRRQVAEVLQTVATLLRDSAVSARTMDAELALRTLAGARGTEAPLAELRRAAEEGLDVLRLSPLHRLDRQAVRNVLAIAEPLDLAVRNVRVLTRRVAVAVQREAPLPAAHVQLLDDLADVVDRLVTGFDDPYERASLQRSLVGLAERSSHVRVTASLSATAILAQVRSVVTDLLRLTGLGAADALALVPPMAEHERPAVRADTPSGTVEA